MGFRLAILAALASQIHAVSKDKVAISSNDQQGTEPEYLPETLKPKAQASETEDPRSILHTRDHLEDVKEYVEEKDLQSLIQTGMSSFLEISSQVHTVGASKPSDAAFFDAVISDDLEGEMERTKPGEKYVVRHMSQHNKQVVRPQKVVSQQQPEEPPKNLPKELHAVFQQMADKYEKNFQHHFSSVTPKDAASYVEESASIAAPGHSYEYKHTIVLEPQILLPVSESILYSDGISSFQRNQMMMSALRDEAQRRGERTITDANAGSSLLQTSSRSKQGYFMDPYPFMTPATVSAGPQPLPIAFTPASLAYQQMGAPSYELGRSQGLFGPSLLSPMLLHGQINPSVGVAAPPPPLRPDNLPPPPYISPSLGGGDMSSTTPGAAPQNKAGK